MNRNNIRRSIEGLFDNNEGGDVRKVLSLSLPAELLKELDEVCETAAAISNKHVTRQSMIENAIETYVDDFKDYLQTTYGVKLSAELTNESEEINTLIVPAHEDGIDTLLKKEWFWLRIGKDKLDKIKFLAVYFGGNTGAITHVAKIAELIKRPSGYKAILSSVEELEHPVVKGDIGSLYLRPNRYVTLNRLLNAREYKDLVDFE